jgi:hypothetical protein
MAADLPAGRGEPTSFRGLSPERVRLFGWLLLATVVVELVALRTATRTLVHIPGTERFQVPIQAVAEGGRLAFYLATVALVAALAILAWTGVRSRDPRLAALGAIAGVFLLTAVGGRVGVLSWTTVGWVSLATLVAATIAGASTRRWLPVVFFVLACVAGGVSVLAQTTGSERSGVSVDIFVWTAEFSLVLAGLAAPLLLRRRPSRGGLLAGGMAALVVAGAFASSSSTVAILLLWNVGVPGWLPGAVYAAAAGGLTATAWSAGAHRDWDVVAGIALLVAGGVGMISTYQSGLVLLAVLVLGGAAAPMFRPAVESDALRVEDPLVPVTLA